MIFLLTAITVCFQLIAITICFLLIAVCFLLTAITVWKSIINQKPMSESLVLPFRLYFSLTVQRKVLKVNYLGLTQLLVNVLFATLYVIYNHWSFFFFWKIHNFRFIFVSHCQKPITCMNFDFVHQQNYWLRFHYIDLFISKWFPTNDLRTHRLFALKLHSCILWSWPRDDPY
jgi:hypothetical protein